MLVDYFYMFKKPELAIAFMFVEIVFFSMWNFGYVWSLDGLLRVAVIPIILITIAGRLRKC